MKPKLSIVYIGMLFCVFAWGSNFIFGAILTTVFKPSVIAIIRLLFIVVFLFFVTYRQVRRTKLNFTDYVLLAVAGLIGVSLNQWSFYASLQYTDTVTAALILALSPIVTAILSGFLLKENRPLVFWIGSLLGLFGVWIVITKGTLFFPRIGKGEVLIGITMLTFSVFLIMVQRISIAIHPLVITWYTNLFGFILLIPFISWGEIHSVFRVEGKYWALLIVTAIVMHGICTLIWNGSVHIVGAAKSALLLNLEPFVAMIVSYLILSYYVTFIQLIGGVIIVLGVTLAIRERGRVSTG